MTFVNAFNMKKPIKTLVAMLHRLAARHPVVVLIPIVAVDNKFPAA